jgi:alpha-D-ribose 1-methylphosphonate 5-triphosphate synthase subunit PhnH
MAVREVAYNEVFDAQKHFRSLLDTIARPGTIRAFDPVTLNPPPGLNVASAMVAFALLDASTTFEVVHLEQGEGAYLSANTGAARTGLDSANFIFANGTEAPDFLESVDCGTLLYPDTGATIVLQVSGASNEALTGGWKLTLVGPGIQDKATLFVTGVNPDLLLALQARNAEFPLGLDTILTFADPSGKPSVAALPRTTKVQWEQC